MTTRGSSSHRIHNEKASIRTKSCITNKNVISDTVNLQWYSVSFRMIKEVLQGTLRTIFTPGNVELLLKLIMIVFTHPGTISDSRGGRD